MKKVVLRAPVLTQSGYGGHSRQVARWLIGLAEANQINLTINPDLLITIYLHILIIMNQMKHQQKEINIVILILKITINIINL